MKKRPWDFKFRYSEDIIDNSENIFPVPAAAMPSPNSSYHPPKAWSSLLSRGLSLQFRPRGEEPDDPVSLRPSWLLSPHNHRTKKSSPVKTASLLHSPLSTPFLSLALLKLEENLEDFCSLVAEPTSRNVSEACSKMDSSVATAGSAPQSPRSPKSPVFPHSTSQTSSGSSPLSPRYWLSPRIGGDNSNHNTGTRTLSGSPGGGISATPSASVLEGEWERYVTPLFFLAAAESIFCNMIHCEHASPETNLRYAAVLECLYQRIVDDLLSVKQTLCDPLIGLNHAPAISVSASLSALMQFATLRMQHIGIQLTIFAGLEIPKTVRALVRMQEAVPTTDLGPTKPLFEALTQQTEATILFLEACWSLQKCLFTESILNLKLCYNKLPKPTTRYTKWLNASHRDILQTLPVYFDRISATMNARYGMDLPQLFADKPYQDLEVEMIDLLRRQEKVGGPPTSVFVILDARGASNMNFLKEAPKNEEEIEETTDPLKEWPPLYARSTQNLSHSIQRISATGKSSGSLSSRSLLWPGENSPSTSRKENKPSLDASKIFEYPPDVGESQSWPYTDWRDLLGHLHLRYRFGDDKAGVSELPRLIEETTAVTFRNDDDKYFEDDIAVRADGAFAPAHAPSDLHLVTRNSTFHVVSLSEYMALVVAVKGEEGKSWHRRRSKLSDEEICAFLDGMADKLRVSTLFTSEKIHQQSKSPTIPDLPEDTEWSDEDASNFLRHVKEKFGLRRASRFNDSNRSIRRSQNMELKTPVMNMNPRLRRLRNRQTKPSMNDSAAALFLGPDLSKVL